MKTQHWGIALTLLVGMVGFSSSTVARTSVYSSEQEAAQACGADEVVWIDLDKGRFYGKNQYLYSKGKNGVFACMKTAQNQYRPGHD